MYVYNCQNIIPPAAQIKGRDWRIHIYKLLAGGEYENDLKV
jgi:hypothetical protein